MGGRAGAAARERGVRALPQRGLGGRRRRARRQGSPAGDLRARHESPARVRGPAGCAARRRARGRLGPVRPGRRQARRDPPGLRGQAALEGDVGEDPVGRDASTQRVSPRRFPAGKNGAGRATDRGDSRRSDEVRRAARGSLHRPSRADRGGNRHLGRTRNEGAGELRDSRRAGPGHRRRGGRLARRGRRRLAAAPVPDRPDRSNDLTQALSRLRRLGRDPAPGRDANLEGHRRRQQGPRGADLQDRRLRDRRRPLRGRARAHERVQETLGEVMRLDLTPEQQMIQATAREFADSQIRPIAAEIDREARFPHETVKRMGELGFMGITIPEAWGGSGADTVSYVVALEEIARASASHAVIMSVNNSLYGAPLAQYGTDAQCQRFLRPVASGHAQGCFALTELQAGSDATNQATLAVRDGEDYVVNGRKRFITTGREAAFALVFCQTDRAKGHRGISAFVIEKGTRGFTVAKTEDKLGIRASDTAELVFDDCRVPRANRLGEEGQGFKIAMSAIDAGRIGIAAQALGIAAGAYERSVAYARDRKAFGVPIGEHQMVQWMLADMAVAIDGARLLTLRAAFLKDAGRPYATAAAMAKLFAAETAMKVTTDAIQVHGGYGFIKEYEVERAFRDAKITQLYEGTSQIQKLVIGRDLLRGGHDRA